MFKAFFTANIPNNTVEYTHSINRLLIASFAGLSLGVAFSLGQINGALLTIGLLYWGFCLAWVALLKLPSRHAQLRHAITIISDIGILCIGMFAAGANGIVLYPLLLWLCLYYGRRFGSNALIVATLLSNGGFFMGLMLDGYWLSQPVVAIGLLIGLLFVPLWYFSTLKEQTARIKQLKQLARATRDSTTQLANRPYYIQRLVDEIAAAQRYNYRFAVIYLELEGFAYIQQEFGQAIADAGLKICTDRLRTISRKSDLTARLNDYRFGMVMRDLSLARDINNFAGKLIQKLSLPFELEFCEFQIAANIGIALFPNHGSKPDELMHKAKEAMEKARLRGDNQYTVYLEDVASQSSKAT
jgi:diguanylate cyclase (GGDEF)-like protein